MASAIRFAPAAAIALVALAVVLRSTPAHAEPPNARATPVYVLTIWTEDSDDQADALTQALRSRVRQVSGWSLLETGQSFETLALALKCPPRPDGGCLQRIADQLHADHYVWGTLTKKKSPGEVTADVRLWVRGKPPSEASETYSESLKDAGDDALRAIAARILSKLTAASAAGALVVHAGRSSGTVVVDGVERGSLQAGTTRIEVPAGSHSVVVRVPGFEAPPAETADVASGSEQEVTFALTASGREDTASAPRSPFPLTKVLGVSALVAGAGLLVAGGVEALSWISDSNASKSDRNAVPRNVTDVCHDPASVAQDACSKSKDALSVSTLGWVFAGVGAALVGTGVVLVTSDHGSNEARGAAGSAARTLQVLPSLGPRAGSLQVRLEF